MYLQQWKRESKSDGEIDLQVYTKLVELDSKIGIKASEQLIFCLLVTTRSDIIEVLIFDLNVHFKIIKVIDLEHVNDHSQFSTRGFHGFAHLYLQQCKNQDCEIDIKVYTVSSLF